MQATALVLWLVQTVLNEAGIGAGRCKSAYSPGTTVHRVTNLISDGLRHRGTLCMWRGDVFAYPHRREDEGSPKEMGRGS